jgi:hypothetical protein
MIHNIPVPVRMAKLPRDRRGYPIPETVTITDDGTAHFTINNVEKSHHHLRNGLCAICGQKLYPKRQWLIGGPRSAFDPNGCFLDTPMHEECASYAIQICPYLAAPNYSKRIDDATMKKSATPTIVFMDETVIVDRPDIFVLGCTDGITIKRHMLSNYIYPNRPWKFYQFWQFGKRLPESDGVKIVASLGLSIA